MPDSQALDLCLSIFFPFQLLTIFTSFSVLLQPTTLSHIKNIWLKLGEDYG